MNARQIIVATAESFRRSIAQTGYTSAVIRGAMAQDELAHTSWLRWRKRAELREMIAVCDKWAAKWKDRL